VTPDEARTVFDGKKVKVDVEVWNGSEKEVVRHPGAVAVASVDEDGYVTFVRQRREPARKQLLELPAGTREEGEEPLATAKRELEEEAGLTGGEWRLAARFFSTPGFCDEVVWLYLVTGVERGEAAPEEGEDIELVRLPVGEIASRLDEIEDAKTLAGLLLLLRER
jgi:ADP-ribose pyrophosphatase